MSAQYKPYNDQNPQSTNQPYPSGSPYSSNNQLYGQQPQKVQPELPPINNSSKVPFRSRFHGLIGTLQLIVGAIFLAFLINTFVFQSYEVVGDSMSPTLSHGDRLVINKVGKTWNSIFGGYHTPKRGEIVVFDSPGGDGKQLVKRVIGIPGDTVVIVGGEITIYNESNPDGFNPDQFYQDSLTTDTRTTITREVLEGTLFVAGDNRIGGASLDSRNQLGLVPLEQIVGELKMRILPLSASRFY